MTTQFVTFRPNINREYPAKTDRYEDFMSSAPDQLLEGWSANTSFEPGDLAIFYITRPLASLVGVGVVDSDPYVIEEDRKGDFNNQVFSDFRPVWFLKTPVPIKEAVQHQDLHPWWKTAPYQSIRRMPDDVAEALINEMQALNSSAPKWLRKLEPIGAETPTRKPTRPKPVPT